MKPFRLPSVQYSLRALLVAVFFASLPLARIAHRERQYRLRLAALDTLMRGAHA